MNNIKDIVFEQVRMSCQVSEILEQKRSLEKILRVSEELGISISNEELQESADMMRSINNLHNAQQTWNWLQDNYLSLDDFEEIVRRNLLTGKLIENLFQEKAKAKFIENQAEYRGAFLYEVIVESDDIAWDIFYSLDAKEINFFDVAQKYIKDKEMRRRGGYLGFVEKRKMKPEVACSVFNEATSRLLKPICGSSGFHIIYVDEIAEPELKEENLQEIGLELFQDWIKKTQ